MKVLFATTNPAKIKKYVDKLKEKDIEIFINNAGYGDCGLFEETDIAKEMGWKVWFSNRLA